MDLEDKRLLAEWMGWTFDDHETICDTTTYIHRDDDFPGLCLCAIPLEHLGRYPNPGILFEIIDHMSGEEFSSFLEIFSDLKNSDGKDFFKDTLGPILYKRFNDIKESDHMKTMYGSMYMILLLVFKYQEKTMEAIVKLIKEAKTKNENPQ